MRTITSVTICVAIALLLVPQFRTEVGIALSRGGFMTSVADYAEEGGRLLVKTVNAFTHEIMPGKPDHSSADDD